MTAKPGSVRWPAEWEAHRATWLVWPHNRETWPGLVEDVEHAFASIAVALAEDEQVALVVQSDEVGRRVAGFLGDRGVDPRRIELHAIPTDDSWVRDTGPVFVLEGRRLRGVDFRFDAWGGKYPPWTKDDALAAEISRRCGAEVVVAPFVLEGGSIDGDGEGTILTTESCLLDGRREDPRRTRQQMEERLAGLLGAARVIWLDGSVEGDDTDGHVDDLARFAAPGVVVAAAPSDADPRNAPALAENLRRLGRARDAAGRRLSVVELPMPPPVFHRGARTPASYANFYLANRSVLVPVFGVPSDAVALAILGEVFAPRTAVPIPARALVAGLGAVHCLTQQEPSVGR